ncbi:MAG: energy-coupling factor transporter transmembrane protein EcfT [Magnetococcus sp. YQC-5]
MTPPRDPTGKLLAFGMLLPILMSAPVFSPVWLAGTALVLLSVLALSLPLALVGRGLWRLRWLFLALLLTHGWFTPGVPLWSPGPALTREGLLAGGEQSLRLLFMALLAWTLMRSTTPMQWVGVFYRVLGGWERFGVPVRRGVSILAFSLASLPRLLAEANRVQEGMALRIHTRYFARSRLERLAFVGEVVLLRVLWDVRQREEGLRARGFVDGLPPVRLVVVGSGWREWGVVLPPVVLWVLW